MLGLRSLASSAARPRSRYAKEQVSDLLLVVEVGRLDLWPASWRIAWLRPGRADDLQLLRTTLLTADARCTPRAAEGACT